jgi:hypothetical protein
MTSGSKKQEDGLAAKRRKIRKRGTKMEYATANIGEPVAQGFYRARRGV